MKTVSKTTISKELVKLNLVLSARKGIEEIRAIADIWFEDCGYMREDRFLEAVAIYRKHRRWFPAPCDIIQEYNGIVASTSDRLKPLPGPQLTPEEIEANKQWVRNLLEKCGLGSRSKKLRIRGQEHAERVRRQAKAILSQAHEAQ